MGETCFDSLLLVNFLISTVCRKNLLDIGTGGGFPSVPIAITYPKLKSLHLTVLQRKIRSIQSVKDKMDLKNLTPVCSRVENYDGKFEVITSRAVSSLKNICEYALPKLLKGGYFVAFKSRKAPEEIEEAKNVLKKYNSKIIDILEYDLPLEEKKSQGI